MAVPIVRPVDSATPCEANIKHKLNAKDSHLRVEDNLSKRFEVNKRPALVTDSVSEKNESSKFGQSFATTLDFKRQVENDQNLL